MFFPKWTVPRQQRVTVSRFLGLDRRARCERGAFAALENLCSDDYPALAVRPARRTLDRAGRPRGLTVRDTPVWVDGGRLYVNGAATALTLSDTDKQFVNMGAYLLIWPDKKYINTADLTDFGSLENSVTTAGTVSLTLTAADGTALGGYPAAPEPPDSPGGGALWLDTSGGHDVLRRWGESGWTEVTDARVRIAAPGIGHGFAAGDGVTLSGCAEEGLNGETLLLAAEEDALYVPGVLRAPRQQTAPLTAARTVPEMDYVTECGNRIWGCKYGLVDGRSVNEIYGSKLGDFRNWRCFAGLSTDSYAASRGSDGPFTAAVPYLGSVLFFKEDGIERLYLSADGAHRIVTTRCPGVRRGSARSVCQADGTLYYHGPGAVYAYQGALPRSVSDALGPLEGTEGVAAAAEGRVYLSLRRGDGARELLVYDARRGLWHREDDPGVMALAPCGGDICALTEGGDILLLRGGGEEDIAWVAESGELGLDAPESKYLQRLVLYLQLEPGTTASARVSYDGGRTWERQGALGADAWTVRHCLMHLHPRRCHSLRLRLEGRGRCRLLSLSAVYEKGSDEG
jgi:hypothetical protein